MKRKIVIGIVAVAVAIVAIALIGMWLDFCNLEAVKWHIGGPKGLINSLFQVACGAPSGECVEIYENGA